MNKISVQKTQILIFVLSLILASIACNAPRNAEELEKEVEVSMGWSPEDTEECYATDRAEYEIKAGMLGQAPEIPKYPESAVYEVCYVGSEVSSVRMIDGEALEEHETNIPVGTYAGKSNFSSTLENDVDDSFSEPVCKENTITIDVESDGTTTGELRSICHANAREGESSIHSEVGGIINGNLADTQGQCIVSYTWRSYNAGPQCTPDTPCRDETVNFDFLYNVNISGDIMTFTPAGDVDDDYYFELIKE